MSQQDVYRELSKKLLMENSTVIPKIWKILCSQEEAQIVNSLPATVHELSEKFSKSQEEMESILEELFHRGAVFSYKHDGKTHYRMPRQMVQFHDATILWDEAPDEMMDLWIEFEETEYPALLEFVTEINMPSFMRVIPINETIETKNQVLTYEDALKMIETAQPLAVTTCVCRKLSKKCDNPLEVCIQINKGAEYTLKRGTGRKIDLEEARDILKRSEEAGLVHMTENTPGRNNVLCNCCTCCCIMLRFAANTKTKKVVAPSRFLAHVDEDECTSCGMCIDKCPFGAITLNADEIAQVDAQGCIGCGLCASVCPADAIHLADIRPEDFIGG
jgi:Pyruvate/2-oxoacid:ferredoxin oxidoreductase delta subunit